LREQLKLSNRQHPEHPPDTWTNIENLMSFSFENDPDLDPKLPLLEREFAEVLIRCIAESSVRHGAKKGLFHTVFMSMSGKVVNSHDS